MKTCIIEKRADRGVWELVYGAHSMEYKITSSQRSFTDKIVVGMKVIRCKIDVRLVPHDVAREVYGIQIPLLSQKGKYAG